MKSPGQNGSRERGFESLKYERLYLEEIEDGLDPARHAEAYRIEYNTIRPHEALAWNSPLDVHLGLVDPRRQGVDPTRQGGDGSSRLWMTSVGLR